MIDEPTILYLPVRKKTVEDVPLTVVPQSSGCQHFRTVIDYRLDQVKCADCGERLNPMWVLQRLANEDRILRDRWATLKAEVHLMRERKRFKCRACGHTNPITTTASNVEVFNLAEKIKRGEEP